MPLIQTDSQHYSDIADAIRDMSGSSEVFYPADMAGGVRSIPQTIAIQPIIYSLEEREVGVHTNGKPLYEKTYRWTINDLHNSNIQSGNMYGEFWLDHISYDEFWMYDTKIVNKGTYWRTKSLSSNTPHESIVIARSNIQQIYQTTNDGYPFIFFKTTDSSAYNDKDSLTFYYTIRYTKTTDTPGSGTWTPSGVPAHHYSTNEQVIGTWLDGSTLYEKTTLLQNISISSNSYTTVTLSDYFQNIGKLVNKIAIVEPGTILPTSFYGNSDYRLYNTGFDVSLSDNKIIFTTGSAGLTSRNIYVTLQYTKTTD